MSDNTFYWELPFFTGYGLRDFFKFLLSVSQYISFLKINTPREIAIFYISLLRASSFKSLHYDEKNCKAVPSMPWLLSAVINGNDISDHVHKWPLAPRNITSRLIQRKVGPDN
jgi:hypothetical protein